MTTQAQSYNIMMVIHKTLFSGVCLQVDELETRRTLELTESIAACLFALHSFHHQVAQLELVLESSTSTNLLSLICLASRCQ